MFATCIVTRKRTRLVSSKHRRGLPVTTATFAPGQVFVYRQTNTIWNVLPKLILKDRAQTISVRAYATARRDNARVRARSLLAVQNLRALQGWMGKAHAGQFLLLCPRTTLLVHVMQRVFQTWCAIQYLGCVMSLQNSVCVWEANTRRRLSLTPLQALWWDLALYWLSCFASWGNKILVIGCYVNCSTKPRTRTLKWSLSTRVSSQCTPSVSMALRTVQSVYYKIIGEAVERRFVIKSFQSVQPIRPNAIWIEIRWVLFVIYLYSAVIDSRTCLVDFLKVLVAWFQKMTLLINCWVIWIYTYIFTK